MLSVVALALALGVAQSGAAPAQRHFEGGPQVAFGAPSGGVNGNGNLLDEVTGVPKEWEKWNWTVVNQIDPLKHLSAISPFYIPTASPDALPPGCTLERVSLLIRHSSIMGNDDEYEQTMKPFIDKIYHLREKRPETIPDEGEWSWLKGWKCPIEEDTLEVVSEQGKKDAEFLGDYIRQQYDSLFPSKQKKGAETKKGKKGKAKQPPYKIWTASSDRDIESAKNYIKGGFPSHQSGPDGHGDGEVVQLIKVPNKAKDWDRSLTPHKACDTFEKLSSLKPANEWLHVYAPKIRERLSKSIPNLIHTINDQDVLAMQMLCGYETIAQGYSAFCHLFTDEEWLDAEYYFDVRFHHMMGYANKLSPYLGMPWVKTADHLLSGQDTEGGGEDPGHEGGNDVMRAPRSLDSLDSWREEKADGKLPKPKLPPNATHTQLLHPSFTHRESPAFVAVFLNLYNSTSSPFPASADLPLDHRVDDRSWRTSHLVSFLGHIALERFKCPIDRWHTPVGPGGAEATPEDGFARRDDSKDYVAGQEHMEKGKKKKHASFVRAVVNGKQEKMAGCEDGIGHACSWETFRTFVQDRAERWGDWESVCEKK